MNIKPNNKPIVPLFESKQFPIAEQIPQGPIQEINTDLEAIVLKTKSKQFEFDCGVIMAHIKVPVNTRFGLRWHYLNTSSVEDFLQSIENFIQASENVVTENDCDRLIKQYEKASK